MTYQEALIEMKEEWKEFLEGCGIHTEEDLQKHMNNNDDFRQVYEANILAIKALEILADKEKTDGTFERL